MDTTDDHYANRKLVSCDEDIIKDDPPISNSGGIDMAPCARQTYMSDTELCNIAVTAKRSKLEVLRSI